MSWQKIFKTAKRLGTPVIFTDQAGDNPMIVLPLEDYEKLFDQPKASGLSPNVRSLNRQADPDPGIESIFELPFEEESVAGAKPGKLAQKSEKNSVSAVEEEAPETGQEGPDSQEISLDERFYFEPLEDEIKK